MDPNATLQTLIFVIEDLQYAHDVGDERDKEAQLSDALDLWSNLREWLKRGGFMPHDDYGLRVASRYMRWIVGA